MEKYQYLAIFGILLIAGAGYYAYFAPAAQPLATVSSPLDSIAPAVHIDMVGQNMTTSVGKATLTITPISGSFKNETLFVSISDQTGTTGASTSTISVYSSPSLTLISGGTHNATYMIPITNQPISLTFIYNFAEANGNYTITYSLAGPVTNSTTVYASG
jgi:hypothetical protein